MNHDKLDARLEILKKSSGAGFRPAREFEQEFLRRVTELEQKYRKTGQEPSGRDGAMEQVGEMELNRRVVVLKPNDNICAFASGPHRCKQEEGLAGGNPAFIHQGSPVQPHQRRPYAIWALTALAALLILTCVLQICVHPLIANRLQSPRQLTRLGRALHSMDIAIAPLQEIVELFGSETGVGLICGEIVTFDRQETGKPKLIWFLSVRRKSDDRLIAEVALAIGEQDFAEFEAGNVSGQVITAPSTDGAEVLEAELRISLANGKKVVLRESMVNTHLAYSENDAGFYISQQLKRI